MNATHLSDVDTAAPRPPAERQEPDYCPPPPVDGWSPLTQGARIRDALPPAGRELKSTAAAKLDETVRDPHG